VEFRGHTATTSAANGRWVLKLPSQKPGGPDTLVIRGSNTTLTFTNVLVGEVWVCSGQSNMEWPLNRSEGGQADIDASANDQVRLFTVPKLKSRKPVDNFKSQWQPCGPSTVGGFSAVAYYFGRDLQKARKVPVGLIHTSWGGSPAEVWIREQFLETDPAFKHEILDAYPEQLRRFEESIAEWEKATASERAAGKEPTRPRPWGLWRPSELYNGMIYPVIPYAIAGFIWYQGESNASRADQYSRLFPTLIQSWRRDWDQGDIPFLQVQLAPWDKNRRRTVEEITAKPGESDWAELREAQLLTLKALPKIGMAVITDVGDKDDIHPTNKRVVGQRLALAARGVAYGERIPYSGPIARRVTFSRGQATVTFAFDHGGLMAKGGELTGFSVCGTNREWVWANARIRGSRVIVSSPDVKEPIAVRYGWSDFPVVNLYNKAGLPASPFRTDNFPLTTAEQP
jgi:sialate O-acetylesterase